MIVSPWCCRDGSESAVGYLGVAAGFACAPLNPRYRANEFDFYLHRLNPKAVIVNRELIRRFSRWRKLTIW